MSSQVALPDPMAPIRPSFMDLREKVELLGHRALNACGLALGADEFDQVRAILDTARQAIDDAEKAVEREVI
jgi:hypothetical protein